MTEAATFENLDRYELVDNGNGTFSVRDTTDGSLLVFDGETNLSQRDAHDLREEYRWS